MNVELYIDIKMWSLLAFTKELQSENWTCKTTTGHESLHDDPDEKLNTCLPELYRTIWWIDQFTCYSYRQQRITWCHKLKPLLLGGAQFDAWCACYGHNRYPSCRRLLKRAGPGLCLILEGSGTFWLNFSQVFWFVFSDFYWTIFLFLLFLRVDFLVF
jgi:hypothetical protein